MLKIWGRERQLKWERPRVEESAEQFEQQQDDPNSAAEACLRVADKGMLLVLLPNLWWLPDLQHDVNPASPCMAQAQSSSTAAFPTTAITSTQSTTEASYKTD